MDTITQTDYTTWSIQQFITADSKPHYDKIMKIINGIRNIKFYEKSGVKVCVFGGTVRNFIQHYITGEPFVEPKDLDIWLDFSEIYGRTHSFNSWRHCGKYLLQEITKNSDFVVSDKHFICAEFGPRETYSVQKININGIDIDICTDINYSSMFKKLSDYTVNNLYFDHNGQLFTRYECEYTIKDNIQHIKEKKLVPIFNKEEIEKNDVDGYYNYKNYTISIMIDKRHTKMIEYGYHG